MSKTDNKHIVDQFWAAFEANDFTKLRTLVDPDVHFKMPGVDARGIEPLVGMLQAYRAAFPDLRHTTHSHVENGDAIAIELLVQGTHTGPMVTPQGTIPATGKKVTWDSCDVIRIKNGRVIVWNVYHDPKEFNALMG